MTTPRPEPPPKRESPPLGEGGLESGNRCDLDHRTLPDPTRDRKHVDQAKLVLLRDYLHEALGFARIYAETAQMFAEIGDDTFALESLARFHHAATSACIAGREIRDLRNEGAR